MDANELLIDTINNLKYYKGLVKELNKMENDDAKNKLRYYQKIIRQLTKKEDILKHVDIIKMDKALDAISYLVSKIENKQYITKYVKFRKNNNNFERLCEGDIKNYNYDIVSNCPQLYPYTYHYLYLVERHSEIDALKDIDNHLENNSIDYLLYNKHDNYMQVTCYRTSRCLFSPFFKFNPENQFIKFNPEKYGFIRESKIGLSGKLTCINVYIVDEQYKYIYDFVSKVEEYKLQRIIDGTIDMNNLDNLDFIRTFSVIPFLERLENKNVLHSLADNFVSEYNEKNKVYIKK